MHIVNNSGHGLDAEALAAALFAEHAERARFRPCGALRSAADAYAVQDALVRRMVAAAGQPAGYKIGLTSERMQRMCGIGEPVAGVILASRVRPSGTVLRLAEHGRAGLEFEIGVRLGRDLPPRPAPFALDEVAAAVEGVCAAVEVVDDRDADYATLDALSLIADNAWNAGAVLGPFAPPPADLEGLRGVVHVDGREVDSGHGRDVLGSPLRPLAWLADRLAAEGRGLRAGDVVMTGNLVTTRFPKSGELYRFELGAVSAVELRVAG